MTHHPRPVCLVLIGLLGVFGATLAKAAPQQPPTQTVKAIPPPADVAAPPADAEKSKSGLAWKVLAPGTGTDHPATEDEVTVHYTGWTTDGKMFDSSVARGRPSSFPLNRLIPGWIEGIPMMVTGEKRRFWVPDTLAYRGRPERPQGTLVFDIELIAFKATPKPPETPPDVAKPPSDAERRPSGLASKVVRKGTGTKHPTKYSTVTVHYSGWTTDGKLFDSSVVRGQPSTFPLDQVIAGWTEGVPLMVESEVRRFWIPANLAYEGREGPQGMLVFDIELIAIK